VNKPPRPPAAWENAAYFQPSPDHHQGACAEWDGDDDTNDVNTFMGAIVAGLKVSDMLNFEGGFGY
jgi:hypothetical protein